MVSRGRKKVKCASSIYGYKQGYLSIAPVLKGYNLWSKCKGYTASYTEPALSTLLLCSSFWLPAPVLCWHICRFPQWLPGVYKQNNGNNELSLRVRVINNVCYLKEQWSEWLYKNTLKYSTLGILRPPVNSRQEETSDHFQKFKPHIHGMNKNPCPKRELSNVKWNNVLSNGNLLK